MTDNDDWNFEVDDDKAPKTKKKKKNNTKPLLKTTTKKLEVQKSGQPQRKSRRQMAREAGGTSIKGRDIVEPASHGKRLIAFSIDSLILVLIIVIGQIGVTFLPGLGASLEEYLGPEIIATIPLDLGGLLLALAIHFLVVIVPTSSSQKSIGKKLMKMKIIGTLKPKPPLGVIVIREYIAKPIAMISVLGIVIILLNKRRRGLHDYIAGTFLRDL